MIRHIHVVFDGPPGPEAGRFVETENNEGYSIRVGEWSQQGDYWHLVLQVPPEPCPWTEVRSEDPYGAHGAVRRTYSVAEARHAMGIHWLPMKSLSQAIPPAYYEWLGREALEHIRHTELANVVIG